jgi:hypothetical protein
MKAFFDFWVYFIDSYSFFITDILFSFALSSLLTLYFLAKTTNIGLRKQIKVLKDINKMSKAEIEYYIGSVKVAEEAKIELKVDIVILSLRALRDTLRFTFLISMHIAAFYSFYLVYTNYWAHFEEDPILYLEKINRHYCNLYVKPIGVLIVNLILWPCALGLGWLLSAIYSLGGETIKTMIEYAELLFPVIIECLEVLRELIIDICSFILEQYYFYLHDYVKKIIIYIKKFFTK